MSDLVQLPGQLPMFGPSGKTRRPRYECGECGGVGSAPTHKPTCSSSRFSLMRLPMVQLIAKFAAAYPARARYVPAMSREQLVSALLEA